MLRPRHPRRPPGPDRHPRRPRLDAGADVDVWTPADLRAGRIDAELAGRPGLEPRPFPFTLDR